MRGTTGKLAIAMIAAIAIASCTPSQSETPQVSLTWQDAGPWPKPSVARLIGQATGVDVDKAGRIYLFHRAGRAWTDTFPDEAIDRDTIAVLDASGRLVASWGKDLFIMPHGLSLDRSGNVWVTDVGAQQVFQFSPDGRLMLTIGERGVSGRDRGHFDMPTDVAFGPDGTVYVSDGYGNSRVVRFTPDGRYLGEWGVPGEGPGQFYVPHGIAVDSSGRVYVADRENSRLQLFDSGGRFLAEWGPDQVGDPYGVTVASDGSILVVDGGYQPDRTRARIVRLGEDGQVLGTFLAASATKEDVLGHDLAVAPDGTIYLADAWANRVRKLVVRR